MPKTRLDEYHGMGGTGYAGTYDSRIALRDRYDCYVTYADDGKGGDITRDGAPLLTFEEWLKK